MLSAPEDQAPGLVGGEEEMLRSGFPGGMKPELGYKGVGREHPRQTECMQRFWQEDAFWKTRVDGADWKAGRDQAMQGQADFACFFVSILRDWDKKHG